MKPKKGTYVKYLLSPDELIDMLNNLTPNEHKLLLLAMKHSLSNHEPETLLNPALAVELDITPNAVAKLKYSLKNKGYMLIDTYKDSTGQLVASLYVGKANVAFRLTGFSGELVVDEKLLAEHADAFGIYEKGISMTERKERLANLKAHIIKLDLIKK